MVRNGTFSESSCGWLPGDYKKIGQTIPQPLIPRILKPFSSGTESSSFPWTGWSPLLANFITKMGKYMGKSAVQHKHLHRDDPLVCWQQVVNITFFWKLSFIYLLQDFFRSIWLFAFLKKTSPWENLPKGQQLSFYKHIATFQESIERRCSIHPLKTTYIMGHDPKTILLPIDMAPFILHKFS